METVKDTRWESISAGMKYEKVNIAGADLEMLVIRVTVWSDRFNQWRHMRSSIALDRLEKHPWIYARTLEFLARDLETLNPR